MIFSYKFGKPIETGAVVDFDGIKEAEFEKPRRFSLLEEGGGFCFSLVLDDKAAVYGLGENIRGINKRGWRYTSYCSDDPFHTESKQSLYGAHNFIVIDAEEPLGVFVDIPGKITFDVCCERSDTLKIITEDGDFYFYEITGDSVKDIIRQFRVMIGKSYVPPLWAFGYQQSRWSYPNEAAVREVARSYREAKIPLDAVYLDIDYMEGYKDFTVDIDRFPDLGALSKELKEQGIHLVPIIDAGVKIEDGYDVYEEGVKNGYFLKDKDGKDYVTAVWPGKTHFPDFLNSSVRRWFGMKYKRLTDMGIDGFWNDMNEPAIFYSERGIKSAWEKLDNVRGKNVDMSNFFAVRDAFASLSNSEDDYKSMYHNMDGEKLCHHKVHNLYGYNMTRSASEALAEIKPNERVLLFSRASYIGMHRFSGIWTGDNQSWWNHILMNLKMLPSLNMCGFLYIGADIGGFGGDTTRDLLLRWLALGVFTPLMRNHSALGTRNQECCAFEGQEEFRELIRLRYRLIPYLYSEYNKANDGFEMIFRPLMLDYPKDKFARDVEDQLMLGDEIMIAPVYTQNAMGRYVYLPEDMLLVMFDSSSSFKTEKMKKGHHYIEVKLNQLPVFIKKNRLLPLCEAAESTKELDMSRLELIGWVDEGAEYILYTDDGISRDDKSKRVIKLSARGSEIKTDCEAFKAYDGGIVFE